MTPIRRRLAAASILASSTLLASATGAVARDLSFEDRVRAQEAIERVYYSHQIGATKSFEEAVPRATLERKVRTYLEESTALRSIWRTPITAKMLHAEQERISRHSRLPERLREIRSALGGDSFLFQECYVRAILAERLAHNFFDHDTRIHGDSRRKSQDLHDSLSSGRRSVWEEEPQRSVMEVVPMAHGQPKGPGGKPDRLILPVAEEEFQRLRGRLPSAVGQVSPIAEERERFVMTATLALDARHLTFAAYTVPKMTWADWWAQTRQGSAALSAESVGTVIDGMPEACPLTVGGQPCLPGDTWDNGSLDDVPEFVTGQSAVWTGTDMIVWGGASRNSGARYDPLTDTWTSITTKGAPDPRLAHSAIWTGTEMIVWGGLVWSGITVDYLPTGGRYNPLTDTWMPMSTINAPSGRTQHTTVWTGSRMIVWGGFGQDTGGMYDPLTDAWSPTSLVNAPSPRSGHTAVWTGTRMVVWGGTDGTFSLNTGGRYDPDSDSWETTSIINVPTKRSAHSAVWTGSVMLVWGGGLDDPRRGHDDMNSGGRYDPETDAWSPMTTAGAPEGRSSHSAVWTGSLMIVWAGSNGTSSGGRYDPEVDSWTPTSQSNAPGARVNHEAVWTGGLMLVWGGQSTPGPPGDGGRYDPSSDSWTPISTGDAPSPRFTSSAIWTGSVMAVWGGTYSGGLLNTGGRYDPASDSWAATSMIDVPSARGFNTAIWTGTRMVVWGGSFGSTDLDSGGRYDPIADAWQTTSLVDAPAPRANHTAVWTGHQMIVWGGRSGGPYISAGFNTGGRYDPDADVWLPTSTVGAPAPRDFPTYRSDTTAAWTGSVMLVWGGATAEYPTTYYDDGARYDPLADAWSPISTTGAPSGRYGHSILWDGHEAIVWGGANDASSGLDTGGQYDPIADAWTPTSTVAAPAGRWSHSAVWTGHEMIVWGGRYGNTLNTGGRYDPVRDAWSATSLDDAPSAREAHVAIWTGTSMILWGDESTGGQYIPAAIGEIGISTDASRTIECARAAGTPVALSATALSCNPASELSFSWSGPFPEGDGVLKEAAPVVTLPLGTSHLTLTVEDSDGRRATEGVVANVVDTAPPQISLALAETVLWPPNHRMVPDPAAWQVSDVCDPTAGAVLVSATSSEPDDDPGAGDGNTSGDIQDAVHDTAANRPHLRAERSADGPGRTYTLTYRARDASGNATSALGVVTVPHDLGTGPEPLLMILEPGGAPALAHVYWNDVPGALKYDVIQGDLDQVTEQSGTLWLGPVRVLASGLPVASYTEGNTADIPTAGKAFFYLVQYWDAQTPSGWGTETAPWPEEPTLCDLACPGEASGFPGSQSLRKK
ncbi:MAG TPA: hypothetical protein VEW47_08835 [Candidatus Dormibacteraeota bacterium]|nr:hypothetical protein [Candidatus Dormibacteraeota bacterium]